MTKQMAVIRELKRTPKDLKKFTSATKAAEIFEVLAKVMRECKPGVMIHAKVRMRIAHRIE